MKICNFLIFFIIAFSWIPSYGNEDAQNEYVSDTVCVSEQNEDPLEGIDKQQEENTNIENEDIEVVYEKKAKNNNESSEGPLSAFLGLVIEGLVMACSR